LLIQVTVTNSFRGYLSILPPFHYGEDENHREKEKKKKGKRGEEKERERAREKGEEEKREEVLGRGRSATVWNKGWTAVSSKVAEMTARLGLDVIFHSCLIGPACEQMYCPSCEYH